MGYPLGLLLFTTSATLQLELHLYQIRPDYDVYMLYLSILCDSLLDRPSCGIDSVYFIILLRLVHVVSLH